MDHEPDSSPGPAGTVRTAALLVTLGVVFYLTYATFRFFFLTFTMAAPVAVLMAPTYERLATGMKGRRSLAATLLVLWTASLIVIPITGALTLLGSQAFTFFSWLGPELEPHKIQHFFDVTLPRKVPWLGAAWEALEPYIAPTASRLLSQIAGGINVLIQRLAAGVGALVIEFGLFFLFLFFLLRDGRALIALLRSISPLSPGQEARVIDHLVATTRGTLLGVLLVPLAQGALAMLGYWMFGVPNALLWGAITIFASMIPLLGAPIVWFPICVYVYLADPGWKAVALFVYGVVVISGIDNILKPLLLTGAARVHPLLGFLAVVGGTLAFGPAGLLVGPIILSLAISALYIYRSEFLHEPERAPGPSPRTS